MKIKTRLWAALFGVALCCTSTYSQQIVTAHMPSWENLYSGTGYNTSLPLYWSSQIWPGVTLPVGVDKNIGTVIQLAHRCAIDELNIDVVYGTTQQWTYRNYVKTAEVLGGMHIAPCLDLPGTPDPKAVAAWLKQADLVSPARSTIAGLPVIYCYGGSNQTPAFWAAFKAAYGPCFLLIDDLGIIRRWQLGKSSWAEVDAYIQLGRLYSFRPDVWPDLTAKIQLRMQSQGHMSIGSIFPGYNAVGMPYKPQGIIAANGVQTMTTYYNNAKGYLPTILHCSVMFDRQEMTACIVPDTVNGTLRPDTCRGWFGARWKPRNAIPWGP